MRLHEHEDFAAFITATAQSYDLPEQFVEKDYWITEILRATADTLGQRAIFKGGTSLSNVKAGRKVRQFCRSKSAPPRVLLRPPEGMSRNVADIPGLDFVRADSKTIGGLG